MPVVTVTIAAMKMRRILGSRHMSQAGLARTLGVTAPAVSYWMKGKSPTLDMILRLVEWSDHYLAVEDFTQPHRRNVAIPEPPPPASSLPKIGGAPARKLAPIVFDPANFTVEAGEGAGMSGALDALKIFLNEGKQLTTARIVKTNFDDLLDYHIVTHPHHKGGSSC